MRTPAAPFSRTHAVDRCCCAGALLAALLAVASPSHGVAAGSLDPNFDGDGRVTFGLDTGGASDDVIHDVALQADGKAVAVGYTQVSAFDFDFLIVRFDTGGELDASFDVDGIVTLPFNLVPGSNQDVARAVAIQPDGKIVVAGDVTATGGVGFDCAVTRLLANGTIDTSFGVDGQVVIGFDLGGLLDDRCYDVLVQPDGRIVLVGPVEVGFPETDFGVVRLLADGTLDPSLDGDGKLTISLGLQDGAEAVARQPDGKLVIAGIGEGTGGFEVAVVRVDGSGTLDGSFGTGGKVSFAPAGMIGVANDLAIDGAGRVVIGGIAAPTTAPTAGMLVARLSAAGQLDPSFNGSGMAVVGFGAPDEVTTGHALALLPDDRILVAGKSDAGGTPMLTTASVDFAVVQLDVDGTLDGRFGSGGRVLVAFDHGSPDHDAASAIALRPDGRLLVAGSVLGGAGAGWDVGFAQLNSNLVFADGYESGNLTAWSSTVP